MAELHDPEFAERDARLPNIADAGVRSTPMVTQLSSVYDEEASGGQPPTVQGVYDEPFPQASSVALGTGSDRYVGTSLGLMESVANPDTDVIEAIERNTSEASQARNPQTFLATKLNQYLSGIVEKRAAAGATVVAETSRPTEVDRQATQATAVVRAVAAPNSLETVRDEVLRALERQRTEDASLIAQADTRNSYFNSLMVEQAGLDKDLSLSVVLGWAKDIGESFVPGVSTTTLAGYIDQIEGNVFKSVGGYYNAVTAFHQLPYDQQVSQGKAVSEYIWQITRGNKLLYMSYMAPFVNQDEISGVTVDLGFDLLDAGIGTGIMAYRAIRTAKRAVEARKAVALLRNTGNPGQAGALNAAIIDSERAAEATGIARETAAAQAQPFDISAVVHEQIGDVAVSTTKAIEQDFATRAAEIDTAITNLKDPELLSVRYFFKEAETRAMRERVVGELQDYPTFARITDTDETGFTVESTTVSKYESTYNVDDLRYQNEVLGKTLADADDEIARISVVNPADPAIDALKNTQLGTKAQMGKNEEIINDLLAPPETKIKQFKYGIDEFGNLDATRINGTLTSVNSPNLWINQLVKDFVDDATVADAQTAIASKYLSDAYAAVLRGTSASERRGIAGWLAKGDADAKVFTPEELATGVHTPDGLMRAESPRQIASYYAYRRLLDQMHALETEQVARKLDVEGFTHEIRLRKVVGPDGKPIRALVRDPSLSRKESVVGEALDRLTLPEGVRRVYDDSTGLVGDVTDDMRRKLLSGQVEVLPFRGRVKVGDEFVTYGVAKLSAVKPRRARVLNYRTGYVPKNYKDVYYVARNTRPIIENGLTKSVTTTERFFKSQTEADRWVYQQANSPALRVVRDRELVSSGVDSMGDEVRLNTYGGLYYGQRTDRDLLMGIEGTEPLLMNPIEATEKMLGHMAFRYPMNEFRMSVISRFQKEFGPYLEGGNWQGQIIGLSKGDPTHKAIEDTQKYLTDFLRIRTVEERQWQGAIYNIAESLEKIPGLEKIGASKALLGFMGSRDPISALRGAAFHTLLGFLNPRQLLIQSLGAVVVHAVDPVRAPKYWGQYAALRSAMLVKSPEAWVAAGRAAGESSDFVDMVKQFNRTGLKDSITQTADYNSAINGVGQSARYLNKALQASTIPFKEGELFVRSMGWLMARDVFLRGKPTGYAITKLDEAVILKDSYRRTLNLSRANRASWQKGITSIPTQFWQITTKFVENMLPELFGVPKNVRTWTPAERAKILTFGTILPFGAAGLPFGRAMVGQMSDMYNQGKDPKDQVRGAEDVNLFKFAGVSNDAWVRLVDQGGSGLAMWYLTGEDINLATRGSIPAGVEEIVRNLNESDGIWDKLAAASGTPLSRGWNVIKTISDLWAIPDWSLDEYKIAANEVASVTSTWSNVHKALWWQSIGKITDSKGRVLDDLDPDEDNGMLLWQALGFPPGKVDYAYNAAAYTRAVKGGVDPVAGLKQEKIATIRALLLKYGKDPDTFNDPTRRRRMAILIQASMADLDPSSPIRKDIVQAVNKAFANGDDALGKYFKDAEQAQYDSRENAVGLESVFTNPMFVRPE